MPRAFNSAAQLVFSFSLWIIHGMNDISYHKKNTGGRLAVLSAKQDKQICQNQCKYTNYSSMIIFLVATLLPICNL